MDEASAQYGLALSAAIYSAFADLLRIAALLADWRTSIVAAEPDTDRFLRAAVERARLWHQEYGDRAEMLALDQAAEQVRSDLALDGVENVCAALAAIPLPIGVYAGAMRRDPAEERQAENARPPDLAVAFLSFKVDGSGAAEIQYLTPKEVHDLEIEVRVSRWPEGECVLRLAPVTIEAATSYDFPIFELSRPQGEPPYVLRQRGRAVINAENALRAQPFEFKYAAEFAPRQAEQPLAVVGHRTLRIESVDLQRSQLSGYHGVDHRLIETRNCLRLDPLVSREDLESTIIILTALANLAGQAVQDAIFQSCHSEAEFQVFVRADLRRRPRDRRSPRGTPQSGWRFH